MTKRALLFRAELTDEGTFGMLIFGMQSCRSLELPWRDNARGLSCIPTGAYRCTPGLHPRFGQIARVADVPGRAGILIHSANFAGDKTLGWTTQLQGCIAPCERLGSMRNNAGAYQRAGLLSRPALTRLLTWADGRPFDLEIVQ